MEIVAKQPSIAQSLSANKSVSIDSKFTAFCKGLEGYRLLLLSLFLIIQGCIFVPATLLLSSFYNIGLDGVSVGVVAAGTVGVMVTNMAEAPVKVVILTFITSTLATITLLAIHLLAI